MKNGLSARLVAYIEYFESLSPESLRGIDALFAEHARFRDPFNDVSGREAIRRVFGHMFATVAEPRFVVTDAIEKGDTAYLRWDFGCWLRGRRISVEGVSRIRFDAAGRVTEHMDYWDPAEAIYSRLPAIGGLLRWLRRRLSA